MSNDDYTSVESLLFCKDQQLRLNTLSSVKELSENQAISLLKKALNHWDRKLRYSAASMIASLLKEDSFEILEKYFSKGLISESKYIQLISQFDSDVSFDHLLKFQGICSHINIYFLLEAIRQQTCKKAIFYNFKHGAELKKSFLKRFNSISNKELSRFLKTLPEWIILSITSNKRKYAYQYFKKRGITFPDDKKHLETSKVINFLVPIEKKLKISQNNLGWIIRDWNVLEKEYTNFPLKKKNGGIRKINVPSERLKYIQRTINEKILSKQKLHTACHGFRKNKSIITNAKAHVGKEIIINIDLKDFFPSITAARVYGLFKSMKFNNEQARFLTRICTCSGILPQGAPTSPTLANLTCRLLDKRLIGLARKLKGRYTRYADDITFSGKVNLISTIPTIREIIEDEGFTISEKKVRIIRKGNRQEVTGLTVNEQVSVPRPIRRKLRAVIHNIKTKNNAYWNGKPINSVTLQGHLSYLHSVHPELSEKFKSQIAEEQ